MPIYTWYTLKIFFAAATYGHNEVHITTTSVVKKSNYNKPMDTVEKSNLTEKSRAERLQWPNINDIEH